MIKAVVFDMDGVIFDSERLVYEEWLLIGEKYGLEDIWGIYQKCIGVTEDVTKRLFLDRYGADCPYEKFKAEVSESFHEKYDNGKLPMKNGVIELLSFLKEHGYRIGLASSTREQVVRREITEAGLLVYFDNLTCGDMLKKSKPEPDIYLMACANLGVKPEEAIAIEDSYNGVRSAYRAGMKPIMVPDMIQPDEEMKKLSYKIFPDLSEVQAFLFSKNPLKPIDIVGQ